MTNIKLLPLPPYIYGREVGDNEKVLTLPRAEDYARAVAEHNVLYHLDEDAVVGVEQVASAIAIEDTGVSWHDVSPRDRTHYVKLARAALAAQKGGAA